LANSADQTTATTIGISWANGASDGGTVVIDYRINFDQGIGVYKVLASNIAPFSYTATGLQAGVTYKFKLESRNAYGYSALSSELIVVASAKPDAPKNLENLSAVTSATQIGLSWAQGSYNGGSPVIDYRVSSD
jgi:hypothetical protein